MLVKNKRLSQAAVFYAISLGLTFALALTATGGTVVVDVKGAPEPDYDKAQRVPALAG